MAIYHLSVKPVSRSAGRSATGAAAYRAGCEIADERTGEIHDYTRKGGVESAEVVLPDGAPEWARDRSQLWNAAEQAEKRKDACVAREFEAALPSELSPEERQRLAVDFAKDMANREGCAVDVCIHAPNKSGDERNHHVHMLRTTRKVEAEGLGAKLDTEKAGRDRKADLAEVRERWASFCNERLREAGHEARVDHRSLEAQGIEREPTQHKGPAITGIERRGEVSEVQQRIEAGMRLRQERAAKERARLVAPDLMAGAERFRQRWGAAKAEKARQEKAEQERQAKERQAKAQAEKEQRQRDLVGREFKGMAAKRAANASGYRDSSEDWQATPEKLRGLIDAYNKEPKATQAAIVERITGSPSATRQIAEMIEERRENVRQNDRGMSLG